MAYNKDGLTDRQRQFCIEYVKDWNGLQAAIRAGYSAKTAKEQASRMLTNINIRKYADALAEELLDGEKVAIKSQVVSHLKQIAFDDNERDETYNKDGELVMVSRRDRIKCNELLGKYAGMFTERVELTGKDGAPIETQSTVIDANLAEEFAKLRESAEKRLAKGAKK